MVDVSISNSKNEMKNYVDPNSEALLSSNVLYLERLNRIFLELSVETSV